MPTAPGSHLLGVDRGMEPQEQGGVALSSASAMPKALPGTIREGGGGLGQRAAPQSPGEESAPGPWEAASTLRPKERSVMTPWTFLHGLPMFPDHPFFLILSYSILEADLHDGIWARK